MKNASVPHRLLRVILAAAFVAAAGSEAYGLRACPLHDVTSRSRSGLADELSDRAGPPDRAPEGSHPAVAGHADVGPFGDGPQREHADVTCTCVGDCCEGRSPTGAVVAVRGQPVDLAPSDDDPGSLERRGLLPSGSRHDLFDLHLPNAPPRPLS